MKKYSILIVDDNSDNISFLGNLLKELYNVEFAMNLNETLSWLKEKEFDLILLDIIMKETDGFQICKIIKKDLKTKEIPIIFLTAKSDENSLLKGFELGAVDYVLKPFRKLELLARIKTHIELNTARKELKKMSITDSLTNLYNRYYIILRFEEELKKAARYNKQISVAMIDIDNFKKINDTHGHLVGDKVIIETSNLIKDEIRQFDLAGRYGGEEFLIILPETKIKDAFKVTDRIRKKIEELKFEEENLKITISGGISSLDKFSDINNLLKIADENLYIAKKNGKNIIIF